MIMGIGSESFNVDFVNMIEVETETVCDKQHVGSYIIFVYAAFITRKRVHDPLSSTCIRSSFYATLTNVRGFSESGGLPFHMCHARMGQEMIAYEMQLRYLTLYTAT